jgi:hypothetical protein
MDYENELKTIQAFKPIDYWKPAGGAHHVVIITEPVDGEYDDGEGNKTAQIKMNVSINKEIKTWTVPKGQSMTSLYGQLMKLAMMNGKKLVGVPFTLLVNGVGNKKRYTIPEVITNDQEI